MNRSDMNYHDYSWTAVQGDNPRMTRLDATRFSRHEGYEVLDLINSFQAKGGGALDAKITAELSSGCYMNACHPISKGPELRLKRGWLITSRK